MNTRHTIAALLIVAVFATAIATAQQGQKDSGRVPAHVVRSTDGPYVMIQCVLGPPGLAEVTQLAIHAEDVIAAGILAREALHQEDDKK